MSFLGHSDLIFDIAINPINDLFLTTSRDNTSRLWDLNKRECLHIIQDSKFASFDDSGEVIASVTTELDKISDKTTTYINLYDVKNLEKAFKVFKIDEFQSDIKQIKFTNDGTSIICSTTDNFIHVVDAYDGTYMSKLSAEFNDSDIFKLDISADSKYVACGTENGNVLIWNLNTGKNVAILECHPLTTSCVKFSPRHTLLASGCINLVLWHPSIELN
jgi:COMPASS component SWD2